MGTIIKVKAHQSLNEIYDNEQMWHAYGNDLADKVPKTARDNDMQDVKRLSSTLKMYHSQTVAQLVNVFAYFAALSRYRLQCLDDQKSAQGEVTSHGRPHPQEIFGQDAVAYLAQWHPTVVNSFEWSIPLDHIFAAVSSGPVFAKSVWYWLHTLRWQPADVGRNSEDWGISWLELVINFRLVSGCDIPIMLDWDHSKATAEWIWPYDERANLLPSSTKGIARQIGVLNGCIRQLERLTGKILMVGKKGIPQTYWRFNFKTQKNGFIHRPLIFRCELTAQVAFDYVTNNPDTFYADACIPHVPPLVHVPDPACDIFTADERRKHYSKLLKATRCQRNA